MAWLCRDSGDVKKVRGEPRGPVCGFPLQKIKLYSPQVLSPQVRLGVLVLSNLSNSEKTVELRLALGTYLNLGVTGTSPFCIPALVGKGLGVEVCMQVTLVGTET